MTLDEFRNLKTKIKRKLRQLVCLHDYEDMHQMRALQWGNVIEDKYECRKCHKVWWRRRKIYREGSWIK